MDKQRKQLKQKMNVKFDNLTTHIMCFCFFPIKGLEMYAMQPSQVVTYQFLNEPVLCSVQIVTQILIICNYSKREKYSVQDEFPTFSSTTIEINTMKVIQKMR